ncbi:MAG: DUF6489 family protein [Chromatiales bacterium]
MKIHIEIDASPQEVRTFFGLPDMEPLQREWMARLQDRVKQGMEAFDPLMAEQMKAFEAMQRSFLQAFEPGRSKTEKKG